MKFYKLAFLEACFNKGYGVTAPVKYLVALFGVSNAIATQNIILTMIVVIAYILFCFIFGYWLFKIGFVLAEAEVANKFNLFVKEMRQTYKKKKV